VVIRDLSLGSLSAAPARLDPPGATPTVSANTDIQLLNISHSGKNQDFLPAVVYSTEVAAIRDTNRSTKRGDMIPVRSSWANVFGFWRFGWLPRSKVILMRLVVSDVLDAVLSGFIRVS